MKVVIVGGVAGGMSTAARLRRLDEQADIVVFERGEHVSFANCGLPYFIGGVIAEKEELLLQTPQSFYARFRVDVRIRHEVVAILRDRHVVKVRDLSTGQEFEESYDRLVLSPGAEPIRPPLQGIDHPRLFTLRNVPDTERIRSFVTGQAVRSAVVVGGGFIGLEMVENLHHLGIAVTLVEAAPQVMAPVDFEMAAMVHEHLREKGVVLHLGTQVSAFSDHSGAVGITLSDGRELVADLAILSIGVRAESRLAAEAGLEIGRSRGIVVNEFLQTSDPDIYAAGDAIEVKNLVTGKVGLVPLAGPANKQGRIIAQNLVEGNRRVFSGAIGTAIAKVFDVAVGATGASEKVLRAESISYDTALVHVGSHAGYYPGATPLTVKVLFAPDSGRMLGGQVFGREGVDRRLDVLAFAIQKGLTVSDLEDFEHTYAPPFSSAKDAVNVAAMVAGNQRAGRLRSISWSDLGSVSTAGVVVVDVRTRGEYSRGHVPGALNIPVDSLRERLSEIPQGRTVVVYCAVGLRAYVAARILMQKGFSDVRSLSGGYRTWSSAQG